MSYPIFIYPQEPKRKPTANPSVPVDIDRSVHTENVELKIAVFNMENRIKAMEQQIESLGASHMAAEVECKALRQQISQLRIELETYFGLE